VGWLIAIIVLIALIWFMIVSPGFRYFIIGIVVLGVIAIYGWFEHEKKESERQQQIGAAQERAALSAITPSDIALDKVQLKKEHGSSWTLTGNVTNNSKYHLGSLGFMVRVEDCPEWAVDHNQKDHIQKECITIGQETARAYVSVPPGQMRVFSSASIYFKGMPATDNPRWRYEITEIRAN
jgi:hypothetical protein